MCAWERFFFNITYILIFFLIAAIFSFVLYTLRLKRDLVKLFLPSKTSNTPKHACTDFKRVVFYVHFAHSKIVIMDEENGVELNSIMVTRARYNYYGKIERLL